MQLMAAPWVLLGYPEGFLSYFLQGERLAKELGDSRNLALFYSGISQHYSFKGDHLNALRYTEASYEEARKVQDIELMVPLGQSICSIYGATGRYKEVVDKLPELIDLIEKSGRQSDFFASGVNPYSYICGATGFALAQI